MRFALCFCVVLIAAGLTAPAAAADCPTHRVRAGDTLRKIAERYLGSRDLSPRIYALNRSRIGPDPNVITPGMRLTIPCVPKRAPAVADVAKEAADEVVAAPVAQATPKTEEPPRTPFVLLAGGPFAPFAGPDLPDGGVLTEIVSAALRQNAGTEFRIAMVNDRPAHLSTLLPHGGFALSFPWVYPDCARPDLMAAERAMCDRFVASDSLFELVTEFYARADSPWARATLPSDLTDARLCRPEGYPMADLVRMGLIPDRVEIIAADTPADCLRRLDAGEVDIASMDAMVTRALVLQMDVQNPLVVLEPLTRFDQLRAVALRDDPVGQAALKALNTGLADLGESGLWFEIVDARIRWAGG